MSGIAETLRARRLNVWEQSKALADKATEENRAFEAEEQGTWDALNEELDKLDARIKSVLDQEKRARDADATFEQVHKRASANGDRVEVRAGAAYGPDEQALAEQLRKLARGEVRYVDVSMPTAFDRRRMDNEKREGRTLTSGSMTMPQSFVNQLYSYLVDTSSIRGANPTVYTTSSGEPLTIPRSTAEGSATWFAENTQITPSDPTLSSVTLNAYKVGKTIYVGAEVIDDAGFDLLGFVAQHSGRNIGIAVDAAYVGGPGSTQPSGFLGSATTISMGTGTVSGFVSGVNQADPIFDAYHGVLPQYRERGSWIGNDSTIKTMRKLKDTTGQYMWQPSLALGAPDTLLGRPVFADPNMEQFGTTGKKVLAFGDFGGYWIRDVTPMRFERSDDFKFDTDVVSFKVVYRTDGKQGDQQAIRVLTTLT